MNSRFALSVALVVFGAVLFLADRVIGDSPSSFPSGQRTGPVPVLDSLSPSHFPTPSAATVLPMDGYRFERSSTFDQFEVLSWPIGRIDPVPPEELWNDVVGFSNKSNREREKYVAEFLFPKAGLDGIRRQSVPYTGNWGPERGDWDGLSNVISRRQGTLPSATKKLIVLGAHFDKVTYPGRSGTAGLSDGILDNASGVNLVAKIAQSLPAPLNDLEVVAFASEEPDPYFLGSRIYFGKLPDEEVVLFFANFDTLGSGNLALVKGASEPRFGELAIDVARNEGTTLVWRQEGKEEASDFAVAKYFGFKGLAFTSDRYGWRDIHVPEDNLNAIDRAAYYRQYLLGLKIIHYLDIYLAEASLRP